MISLIVGAAGTGKTTKLTELANENAEKTKGHLVYLDHKGTRMLQINYKIRYINVGEYEVTDGPGLYSFICGVIASNYDIETIYIDGLYKMIGSEEEDLKNFFSKLDHIELKYNINFVITISSTEEDLPDFLKEYALV